VTPSTVADNNEGQQDFVSFEMRNGKFESSSASSNADLKLDKAGSYPRAHAGWTLGDGCERAAVYGSQNRPPVMLL
jgi:hypothetical protein